MVRLVQALLATAVAAGALGAAKTIVPECGRGYGKCPSQKPCCTQYGVCGIGGYCLGGCDPLFSTSLDSCVPNPVCQDLDSTFPNLDKVVLNTKYLGDATKYDWVVEGKPVIWNGNLLLTMPKGSVGTVLSSTRFMWYGSVTATMKTSRGAGVVSSLILFSGVRDEIDYEWVGVDLQNVQTNYYFQGIPDYTHGGNSSVDGNTFEEWHTYTIDWTPEKITWLVDGKVGRVTQRKDTWNETDKIYHYPQTPSRVQLSLWPGGLETNAQGTINWAGGPISWDTPDIKQNGYYFVTIKDVKIKCYDPPAGARKKGSKAYIYDNESGLESSVVIVDKNYVLKSFLGTGTNMDYEPDKASPSAIPSDVETVPGLKGGGTSAGDISNNDNGNSGSSNSNDNGLSQHGGSGDFDQGLNGKGSGTGSSTGAAAQERRVALKGGSMFAVAVAILALVL